MIDDNKEYQKVYDKLCDKIEAKLLYFYKIRSIGGYIDYNIIKLLNLYINYLNRVKDSKYTYYHIKGLDTISNSLNKI